MEQALDADVIVIGLGAMGSHTLWRLARRGVRAIGVEQFGIGHDRGASHGESKIIRTAYWEGSGYVPLARSAWELWRELEGATGIEIVSRTGALTVAMRDSPVITGALAAAEAYGLDFELLDAAAIARRFPRHRAGSRTVAFRETDAGLIRPEAAVLAAVRAARDAGATVIEHQRVGAIVPDPVRPRVRLGDRELAASHVVVAAGGWVRCGPCAG
jgi:sarcosine oxidase